MAIREEFWCSNCDGLTSLTIHGRCQRCQSEAVDIASRERPQVMSSEQVIVEALEALWRL